MVRHGVLAGALGVLEVAAAAAAASTTQAQYPKVPPPVPCEPPGAMWGMADRIAMTGSRPRLLAVVPFQSTVSAQDTANAEFVAAFSRRIVARLTPLHATELWTSEPAADSEDADRIIALGATSHARYVLVGLAEPMKLGIAVTIRLYDTKRGKQAWQHTYTRSLDGFLALEGEIARAVATVVQGGEQGPVPDPLAPSPTANPTAYRTYLRGAADLRDTARDAPAEAMEAFSSATRLDPGYAAAWSGFALAAVARIEHEGGRLPSANAGVVARALAAVDRAVQLAPTSAETWVARGAVLELVHPADYAEALTAYRRALKLEPWSMDAHRRYALALVETGAFEEGLEQLRAGLREGPTDPATLVELGSLHVMQREYRDACHAIDAAIESAPRDGAAYVVRAVVRLRLTRDIRNAYGDAETGVRLGAWLTGGVAAVLADASARDTAGARRDVAALVAQMPSGAVDRPTVWQGHYLAVAYTAIGDNDRATALLQKIRPRGASLWWALRDPGFDRLQKDTAFTQLLSAVQPTAAATRPAPPPPATAVVDH